MGICIFRMGTTDKLIGIDELQKSFLFSFFDSPLKDDFYLTGGTALSTFYLHHRRSIDLDFFTVNKDVDFAFVNGQMLSLIKVNSLTVTNQISTSTYLQYLLQDEEATLKVDLVKDTLPHFGESMKVDSLNIDSLENIAVGKLLALYGRADPKDFIDLYFLLEIEKKIKFDELFSKAKQKDAGLHEIYLAEMMSRVHNVSIFPEMLKSFDKDKMKEYFIELSHKLLNKIKP